MKVDLHCHSTYSDGTLTPLALASVASASGASVVSLTDHDTISGVALMNEACKQNQIVNIQGVEISTFDKVEIHILGYNIDINDKGINQYIASLQDSRNRRVYLILDKLSEFGINITFDQVRALALDSIARSHIASAIVKAGYSNDVSSIYKQYLAFGACCYVPHIARSPRDAIAAIHDCGGIAVLAHPVRLELVDSDKVQLIDQLVQFGLDGIEASYRNYPQSKTEYFEQIALQHNLIVTNGGDFHTHDRDKFCPRPISPSALSKITKVV